jgi:hypothetical protein
VTFGFVGWPLVACQSGSRRAGDRNETTLELHHARAIGELNLTICLQVRSWRGEHPEMRSWTSGRWAGRNRPSTTHRPRRVKCLY